MKLKIYFDIELRLWRDKDGENPGEVMRSEEQREFFRAAESVIKSVEGRLSPATVSNYWTALRAFGAYAGKDTAVGGITASLLKGFERHLQQRRVRQNTSSCYMRSLRALLSKIAGKEKLRLFDDVYTGKAKTQKRAISEAQLSAIKALQLREGSFLCLARDTLLFSYYACGMPFVDIAFMHKDQIGDGKLVYSRHKTGVSVTVTLEPCMTEIIERYKSDERQWVFPFITTADENLAYDQYLKALNHYNRSLKALAMKAGIAQSLTSYVARHSWASSAYAANVDMPVISSALGHAAPQTTMVYIKGINDNRLAAANRAIIGKIRDQQ